MIARFAGLEGNQGFLHPIGVVGDDIGGTLGDQRAKAERPGEVVVQDRFGIEDIGKVMDDVVGSCASPFVDGLVIIPHHHDIGVIPCQQFDQALLAVVDILVFVHDDEAQVTAPALVGMGIAFQDIDSQWDEVIKGQGKGCQSVFLELGIDQRQVG